jgi:hypothetical protein
MPRHIAWVFSLFLVVWLCPASAGANVLTELLDWRTDSLELGLARLKEQFLDMSTQRDAEFVGAVFQMPSGAYQFTQGQGQPGQNQVTFRIRRRADQRLVGFWHTHGAEGPSRAVFSPTDAKLVRQTGLPFYLIAPDGEIRVLRPEHLSGPGPMALKMGEFARLPRGSHPGERVTDRRTEDCPDVMEV